MKTTLKKLLKNYDIAKQTAKDHYNECEVVMSRVCIDSMTEEEYEDKCTNALFLAGLTDRDGCTDVYENERISREKLLNFIFNIIPKQYREYLKENRYNVAQMDRVIELARKLAE